MSFRLQRAKRTVWTPIRILSNGAEMELNDFRVDLLETVRARAESTSDFNGAGFVEEVGQRLCDAEEFADFQSCRYEGIGVAGRKKLRVDGYAFDDVDNSMSLVIAEFSNDDDVSVMNTAEAVRSLGMVKAFVEEALRGDLTDGSIEESQPGFGLASNLIEWQPRIAKFRIFLVTDSELKSKNKDWPDEMLAGVPVEFHIWDIVRFHTAYISATGRDELVVDFSQFGGQGLPCLKAANSEGDYQAYLCVIPGVVLAGIYDRYGSRLLEGNVRSFLSSRSNKVNTKMQTTIWTQPEMFFAFNNGIAATAEDVVVEQRAGGIHLVSATNLQIVNGGQTTASLAAAARGTLGRNDRADLAGIMVQMKLSVLPSERAGDLIPDIAKYANSQTKVSDADFFSNHPYHVRLEEFSRRLFVAPAGGAQHGTRWFYERARGQYVNEQAKLTPAKRKQFEIQNPKSQLLTKTDIAKFANTWRGLPQRVSMGAQKNFMFFAESISQAWAADEPQFNEHYFRNLISLAIIFRRTEVLVKQANWYQGGYRANIVTYTIAKLKLMVDEQGDGKRLNLRAIWDKQSVPAPLLEQLSAIAQHVFEALIDPSRPKDNVTEWAKMTACWDNIKSLHIELSSGVVRTLQDGDEVNHAAKDARAIQATDNGIAAQVAVLNIAGAKWNDMRQWGEKNDSLTPKESDLLRIASQIPSKLPTDKQCTQIWQLRSRLLEAGFVAA
jgi:hypothetical protein